MNVVRAQQLEECVLEHCASIGRPLTRVDATNREGETERRELTLCRIGIHGCEEDVIELP